MGNPGRRMRVISRKMLEAFWSCNPKAKKPLEKWYQTVRESVWNNFADVRGTFNTADQVGALTVFDVGGNKFRVIAFIEYRWAKVFVRHVLTHEKYDRGLWKE